MAALLAVLALGGCGGGGGSGFSLTNPSEWFSGSSTTSRPVTGEDAGFTVTQGARAADPTRPVADTDLVAADGACQGALAEGASPVIGITLAMTECALVSFAGRPDRVDIGAAEGGRRQTVLVYTKGDHPGTYTFQSGRLKIIDPAPAPERPARRGRRQRG